MPRPELCLLALLLTAIMACAPAPAEAAEGLLLPVAPRSMTTAPPGYELNARQAIARAERVKDARVEAAKGGNLVGRVFEFDRDWQVSLYRSGREVVRIQIDGRDGHTVGSWTGYKIVWPLARGAHGAHNRRLHAALIFSGLLFLLPFLDRRRPFRMLHLDMLVLLSFGISHVFAARGDIDVSVPLVYPPLVYLVVRLGWIALRGSGPDERLSWVSPRVLLWGLVALLVLRYGYDVFDSKVNDVGYASVYGADSIRVGAAVYDSAPGSGNLDTYGPFAYLAYLPFVLLFPLHDLAHSSADAAKAAAIVFDLVTVVGLVALGRRLRPGAAGHVLGLALGWGYAAFPWSLFVLSQNTNDGLVAMLLVLALLSLTSPGWRGALLALAVSAKFAPATLVALFARAGRESGRRTVLVYGATFVGVVVVLVVLLLPDGGLRELWDATIGFQVTRSSPFSIWGLHPGWKPLLPFVSAAVALAAGAALFLPRDRRTVPIAAAGAALLIATQLTARHWFYFYLVWFAPYALVALMSRSYPASVRNSESSSPSAVAVKSS